jgi:UDP-3-O-acyl-N-acetylglucosamine deacetylase
VCGQDVATLPEHVLAALVLLDVDAVEVVFEGGEAPIGDGSSSMFLAAIRAAGLTGRPRSTLRVSTDQAEWSGGHRPGRARTFLQRGDAGALRSLFPGARPGCAVVVDGSTALYGGRAPMRSEQPTHKLLDLLGDLGPWRAAGPLTGHLHVADPRHVDNPGSIARAFDCGQVRRA